MLGDLIREARRRNRWTQRELGDRVGVGSQEVSRWERNEHEPSTSALEALRELEHFDLPTRLDTRTWMRMVEDRLAALEALTVVDADELPASSTPPAGSADAAGALADHRAGRPRRRRGS